MDNPEKLATLGKRRHRTKTNKTITQHRKTKKLSSSKNVGHHYMQTYTKNEKDMSSPTNNWR
jgi:hypothetical protein